MKPHFKTCPLCGEIWGNFTAFIKDKNIKVNGYQADFDIPENGLLFFTHEKENCYTTMALLVEDFFHLYNGEKYTEARTGKDDCPGLCFEKENLEGCTVKCKFAFIREIIQEFR